MALWESWNDESAKPKFLTPEQKKNCYATDRGWVLRDIKGNEELIVAIKGLKSRLTKPQPEKPKRKYVRKGIVVLNNNPFAPKSEQKKLLTTTSNNKKYDDSLVIKENKRAKRGKPKEKKRDVNWTKRGANGRFVPQPNRRKSL